MKRLLSTLAVLLLLGASIALAMQKSFDFTTGPGQNGRAWPITFVGGKYYQIIAKVRPAGWDPRGAVASMVQIRLIVFAPDGSQIADTGGHGGTASYSFRPPASGQYEVQVVIAAPLGALGKLTIIER